MESSGAGDADLTEAIAVVSANFLSAFLPARLNVRFATLASLPKSLEATFASMILTESGKPINYPSPLRLHQISVSVMLSTVSI